LTDPSDDDDLCQKLLFGIDLGQCSTIGFQTRGHNMVNISRRVLSVCGACIVNLYVFDEVLRYNEYDGIVVCLSVDKMISVG
jgi:hypothetical protein